MQFLPFSPRPLPLLHAIERFSPSTLSRYFTIWETWATFASAHGSSPAAPQAGLLPDWLATQRSAQGLATGQLRALNWFARRAGLPVLGSILQSALSSSFSVASAPAERRESAPFSLSFVVWLEQTICRPDTSEAEVLQIGTLLLILVFPQMV